MEYLSTKDDPMASWMIEAIKENATAASARTSLESTIAAYSSRQNEIVTRVIASFLMDTLVVDSTLFTPWVNKLNGPSGDYILAENLMQNGQTTAATNILNEVPTKYNLSVEETSKHNALMAIYDLSNVLNTSNRDISQLNLAEIVSMQNIANGERCLAKTMAINILELNGIEPPIEEVLYPEPASEERRSKPENNLLVETSINSISVSPNPANELVQINLPQENYTITVYSSSGQLIAMQQSNGLNKISVNTINYAEGLYLIIVQGIKVQQEYKVSIKH
jgi:hypothetical protein